MSQGSSDELRGVSGPFPFCQSWLVTVTPPSPSPQLSLSFVFQMVSWLRRAGGPMGSPSHFFPLCQGDTRVLSQKSSNSSAQGQPRSLNCHHPAGSSCAPELRTLHWYPSL